MPFDQGTIFNFDNNFRRIAQWALAFVPHFVVGDPCVIVLSSSELDLMTSTLVRAARWPVEWDLLTVTSPSGIL